jgi:hypothetical protein
MPSCMSPDNHWILHRFQSSEGGFVAFVGKAALPSQVGHPSCEHTLQASYSMQNCLIALFMVPLQPSLLPPMAARFCWCSSQSASCVFLYLKSRYLSFDYNQKSQTSWSDMSFPTTKEPGKKKTISAKI